jgi:K+ transporter
MSTRVTFGHDAQNPRRRALAQRRGRESCLHRGVLTRLVKSIPPLIVNYVKQGRSLQENVIALTVSFENVPRVRSADRVRPERIDDSFWHVTLHFGFVEIPDIPSVLGGVTGFGQTHLFR